MIGRCPAASRTGGLPTPWADTGSGVRSRLPSRRRVVVFRTCFVLVLAATAVLPVLNLSTPVAVSVSIALTLCGLVCLWLTGIRVRLRPMRSQAQHRAPKKRQASHRVTPAAEKLPDAGRVALMDRLTAIEQTVGDVLYQLDRTRGTHELSGDEIASVRAAGLRASSWLSGKASQLDALGHDASSEQLVETGIKRYASLADAVQGFLDGNADAPAVFAARDRLDSVIDS